MGYVVVDGYWVLWNYLGFNIGYDRLEVMWEYWSMKF